MTPGYAITTLVVYIISIFFAICPVAIPAPYPINCIPLNLTTAPILAIGILWATQCLDLTIISDGLLGTNTAKPCNILILLLSVAYMAITLDLTDILWTTLSSVSNRGHQNGWKVYFYFFSVFSILSILLGKASIITTGTGFLVHYTDVSRLEHRAWTMAEFAAANTAGMLLFVGDPTNVIISEGFGMNSAAFTAYTIVPCLACQLSCFVALVLQYKRRFPRQLPRATAMSPRPAWDPVGAMVGSVMLGAALIVSLAISFKSPEIDAWMITSMFTVVKLVFDLGWDFYRHSYSISVFGRTSPMNIPQPNRAQVLDEESLSSSQDGEATPLLPPETLTTDSETPSQSLHAPETGASLGWHASEFSPGDLLDRMEQRFPTLISALQRMPFFLVPLVLAHFILVEALNHQGWVNVFADWLARASGSHVQSTIWLVGVLSIILSNLLGTNIGATILLIKVVRAAHLSYDANLGAAIALVVASNLAAVGFTFSASFVGLLWRKALQRQRIEMRERDFAIWNIFPLLSMTLVGLWVVCAEMAFLFPHDG